MPAPFPAPTAGPGAAATLRPIRLADLTPTQLTHWLAAPLPLLLIDCGGLLLPHPLGVCRFVAELLLLRQRGTDIGLCNVHPMLRRYLHELQLSPVFHFDEPALPTPAAPPAAAPATHA